jgi:DNA-binding beta-propeller fold protein YncE
MVVSAPPSFQKKLLFKRSPQNKVGKERKTAQMNVLRVTTIVLMLAQAMLVHSNIIAPFAGDHYLGDGDIPTRAYLYNPTDVAVDSGNNLVYIADTNNNIIRVVNQTSNTISTFAGIIYGGSSGDGKY